MATGGAENKKNTNKKRERGDCPAWNFDWQHFCVSTFLAASYMCVRLPLRVHVCVCVSQSSIKLFVLFGLPYFFVVGCAFHLFKTQLLCRAESWGAASLTATPPPSLASLPYPLPSPSLHICANVCRATLLFFLTLLPLPIVFVGIFYASRGVGADVVWE